MGRQDRAFRQRFHRWLEDLWQAKDRQIAALLSSAQARPIAIER